MMMNINGLDLNPNPDESSSSRKRPRTNGQSSKIESAPGKVRYMGVQGRESIQVINKMISKFLTFKNSISFQQTETALNRVKKQCQKDIPYDEWHKKCTWSEIGIKRPECKSTCASHMTAYIIKMLLLPKKIVLHNSKDTIQVQYSNPPWSHSANQWLEKSKPHPELVKQLYFSPWASINFVIQATNRAPYSAIYLEIILNHVDIGFIDLIDIIFLPDGTWRNYPNDVFKHDHHLHHADIPNCCTFPPYVVEILKRMIKNKTPIIASGSFFRIPINDLAKFHSDHYNIMTIYEARSEKYDPDTYPELLLPDANLMTSIIEDFLPGYNGLAEKESLIDICLGLVTSMPHHYNYLNINSDEAGRKLISDTIDRMVTQNKTYGIWQIHTSDLNVNMFLYFSNISNHPSKWTTIIRRIQKDVDMVVDYSQVFHTDLQKILNLLPGDILQNRHYDCNSYQSAWAIMAYKFALGKFFLQEVPQLPDVWHAIKTPYFQLHAVEQQEQQHVAASSSSSSKSHLPKLDPRNAEIAQMFRVRLDRAAADVNLIAKIQTEKQEWIQSRKQRVKSLNINTNQDQDDEKEMDEAGDEEGEGEMDEAGGGEGEGEMDEAGGGEGEEGEGEEEPHTVPTFGQYFFNIAKDAASQWLNNQEIVIRLYTDMTMYIDLVLKKVVDQDNDNDNVESNDNIQPSKLAIYVCVTLRQFNDSHDIKKAFSSQGWENPLILEHIHKSTMKLWQVFPSHASLLCKKVLSGELMPSEYKVRPKSNFEIEFPLNFMAYVCKYSQWPYQYEDNLTRSEEVLLESLLSLLPTTHDSISQILQPIKNLFSLEFENNYAIQQLQTIFNLPTDWLNQTFRIKEHIFPFSSLYLLHSEIESGVQLKSSVSVERDYSLKIGPTTIHSLIFKEKTIELSDGLLLQYPKVGALISMFQLPANKCINNQKYYNCTSFYYKSKTMDILTVWRIFIPLCAYLLCNTYDFKVVGTQYIIRGLQGIVR